MRRNRKKNFLFLIIVLALAITIGYAFVTENLKINGGSSISSGSWIIYFDKIENESGVISPNTTISKDKQTIDFDISIKKPGDYYEFDVDTVNDGTIDAMIDSIQVEGLDNTYKKLMSFDVVYKDTKTTLHKCDLLPKKSRKTVTVKVKYTEDITEEDLLEKSENINLKFKINYVQDGECTRNPLLTVNPNGGTYKGLRNVQDEEVEPNSTVRVEAPKYTGRNFKGYELEDGTLLEKEADGTTLVEVLEDDIVIKAIWDRKDYIARIVDNNTYYETLQDAIDESLDGQTVELLRSTTENPENNKNITIDLGTNIVNGTFTNDRGYTLTLKNGTVRSDTVAFINNGTLNLGVKDGNYEEDNIILRGEEKGLQQNGTFNFYDGYIIAKLGLVGGHNDKEVDYYVYVENNTAKNYQKVFLTKNIERAVVMTRYNGEIYYNNLQNAIDVTTLDSVNDQEENGYTMYAVRSFEAAYKNTLNQDDIVTLDLNGFDVETGYTVINNGNFTITDSVSGGSFIPSIPIENNNTLNIKDTLLKASANANIIENNETLTITNSTITSKGGYSIVNKGAGTVSIDKDTIINGDNYNFKNTSSTPLTFTEGTIYNLENSGTITLKEDALVTSSTQEYATKNTGTINLEGGEVTGYNGINNTNRLNIKSGTITTEYRGVLNTGTLELTGGEIVSSWAGIESSGTLTGIKIDIAAPTGILNYGTATLSDDVNITSTSACIDSRGTTTVNGGSYIGSGNSVSCNGGNTTLNSGTFKSTSTAALNQSHGTLNLKGGTVESPTIGVYTKYATFNMEGGTITAPTGVTGVGARYEGNAYINISGGIINSTNVGVLADKDRAYYTVSGGIINVTGANGIGIKNSNPEDLSSTTITGGTINAGKYGVYNEHAPLTIGENNTEIVETPVIKGELYGVYVNSGKVNFYDGLLKGITDGHYGEIVETPTNAGIYEREEVVGSKTYTVHYVKIQTNWLRVGNQEFNSINDACEAIDEEGTIEVIADADVTFDQEFLPEKKITFDLNGYSVKFGKSLINNADVEIIDSSDEKTGTIKILYESGIENNKTLKLNEIKLDTVGAAGLKNYHTGTLTLEKVNFTTTSENAVVNGGGTITINSTDITTDNTAIYTSYYSDNSGIVTVNNSNLTSNVKSPIYTEYGAVVLNNSSATGKVYGANIRSGKVTLNSGSINGDTNNVYNTGTIEVNGGNIISDSHVAIVSSGTVIINGGNVKGTTAITETGDGERYAVNYPVTITGGKVVGTTNEAVKIVDATLKVTGGEVISLQSNAIYSDGYVEIGDNSNEIKEVPTIQGYEYAIYDKDLKFYTKFFDGILKGRTLTNNGLIDEIPDGSMIEEKEETIDGEVYQTKTLIEFGNFLRVDGVEYNSFKKASDAIGDDGGTIEVIKDAYVNFEAVLPESKNITLDLRGHTLVMTQPLETKGNNSIVDSSNSQNGLIRNIYTNAVENTGTLTIYGGTYKSEEDYALRVTSGTTTLEGGNFTYKKPIYVDSYAKLVVNDANVSTEDETAIYNHEGLVTVNGGEIHSENKSAIYLIRATANINGGEISSVNDEAIQVVGYSFTMNDGHVYSEKKHAVSVTEASATITGGKLESNSESGLYIGSSTIAKTSLKVTGGEFIGKTYGIDSHGSSTTAEISGGTMKGEVYGINDSAKYELISDAYIEGGVNGINHTNGSLVMTGGTAVGKTQYGLYSTSSLTLGEQDRNVDISNPLLIGELYGLYSAGSTDFYDGILKGKTYGYTGKFANIEVATQIWNDTETIDDVLYKTTYLIEERDIAENMRTHEKYNNLETALNSTEAGDTVKLINNAPIYYPVRINDTVDITFDMNGYDISTNKKITNNGKVQVVNNSGTTSSIKTAANINLITTTNEMSISNVEITNTSTSNYILTNSGILTLTNSNISSIYGINSSNSLTLTNTNVSATSTTINSTGLLSINGGEYSGSTVVYSLTSSDVSIKNTKLLGTNTSLYNSSSNNNVEVDNVVMTGNLTTSGSTSTTTINALTLTGNYSNSSNTTMTSSSINSTLTASYYNQSLYFVTNSKKLDMDTVTLNLTTTGQANFYGIHLSGNATSEISNLSFTSSGVGNTYGIYLQDTNNNAVLTDGSVDVSGTNAYGVYINRGEFVLGISDSEKEKEDKVVSITDPLITSVGTSSGIGVKKVDGLFKYYDGKIIGSSRSKPDTTTEVEEGYEASIYMDTTTGYEYCILENLDEGYQAVARMNGVYYNTVQDAINNSKTGSVITLLKNTIENVENTKNITLDLNNHRITGRYFNRGTTRIINGSLYNYDEVTVQNTGTLILGEEGGEVSTTSVGILNENTTSINQLGRLIIYDGYVRGLTSIRGEVTLTENGYAAKTERQTEIDEETGEEVVISEKTYLVDVDTMDDDEEKPTYSFMVTIDPNGGLYKGTSDIEENFLMQGETLEITEEPTREGYVFSYWEEVSDTNAYENGVVTVDNANVELRAVWTVTDQVVAKVGDNYYITLNKAYQAAINGDKIELLKDVSENLTNDKIITLDLGGHTINGTITNNGELNLDNGKVLNTENTPIVNNGTLNMGVDEGQMSTSSIIVFGGDYGISQNGVFNFYDGTVEGKTAIDGSYNKGAAGYFLYVDRDNENDCQKVYLIKNSSEAVARVVNGGDYFFYSLQDAINATNNSHPTVYLLKDIESSYQITVNNNQKLEIDLDGHILTYGSNITNNGELSLVDSGNITKGKLILSNPVVNNNKLKLDNIVINAASNSANLVDNSGDITINKSTLTAKNGYALNNKTAGEITLDSETVLTSTAFAVNNIATEEVTITGGTIVGVQNTGSNLKLDGNTISNASNKYAISNGSGSLTLDNVNVTSTSSTYGVYNNDGSLTINSGEYTASSHNTIYSKSGSLTITGGNFKNTSTGYTTVFVNSGTATVTGGTFSTIGTTSVISSFRVSENATANINGGVFSALNSNTAAISSGGNTTINDITINSTNGYGLYANGGTLTINDGSFKSSNGNALYASTTVTINGGNFSSSSADVIYQSGGTLTINDGTIIADGNNNSAIRQNSGTQNIKGGKIVSNNGYGVYLTGGTLTLGINDETISKEKPEIIGKTYGAYYSSGTFNFYDGILLGQTAGLYGEPTVVPRRYQVVTGEKDVVDEETLETTIYKSAYLDKKIDFVQVGDKTFNDLQDAIDEIETTGTMTLIGDSNIIDTTTIPDEKTILWDLNGHSLTFTKTITNNGTLTIDDNSVNKMGSLVNNSAILMVSYKALTVNEGNFTSKTNTIKPLGGTFTMNGGTINGSTQHAALYISNSTAIINGGAVNSNGGYSCVAFENNSTGTINNLIINATNVNGSAFDISNSNVTIKNANVNVNNKPSLHSDSNSVLTIEGGTFTSTSSYGAKFQSGTVNITGGTIKSTSSNAIYNSGSTTTIDGENVKIISTNSTGVENSSGIFNFKNGSINSGNYGLYNNSTATITGGEITSTNTALYNRKGTLAIGENDENVSIISPKAKSDTYGLYIDGGTVNVYDGIFEGKTEGYSGLVSSYPKGYNFVEGIDGEYKTAYLGIQDNFVQVGEQEFNNLQDAIDAIETTGTMTLIANANTTLSATIPDGKTITFDLNDKQLTTTKLITNNGNLTIDDNSTNKNGSLTRTDGVLLSSNKNLTINAGIYTSNSNTFKILSGSTLNLNGGTINGSTQHATIYAEGSNVIANGGTINCNGNHSCLDFQSSSTGTINNLNINVTGNTYGVYIDNSSLTIKNINATSVSGYSVINSLNNSILNIEGGSVTNNNSSNHRAIASAGKELNISGGTFNSNGGSAIYTTSGTNTITGGHFKSTNRYGIECSGTTTINGENILIESTNSTAISNSGTLTIKSGTFNAKSDALYNASTAVVDGGTFTGERYGIYQYSGTLTLGIKDGTINKESPLFEGETYGLYINGGTVNFYDGILKGKTKGYTGNVTNIETDSFINEEDEILDESTTLKVAYLIGQTEIIQNDATKEKFTNIQTAITEAASGEKLVMLDNASVYYDITIPDKEVILDMAGYKITTNRTIENNGDLSIIDSSQNKTGEIKSTAAINLITNNQSLTINDIKLSITSSSYYMISNNSNATLTINRATLNAPYTLYNYNNATINNSTITGNYGIRNENTTGSLALSNTNITTTNWCIYNYNSSYSIDGGTLIATNDNLIYTNGSNVNESTITNEAVLTKNSGYVINSNSSMKLKIEDSTITGDIYNNDSNIKFDTVDYTGKIDNRGTMNINSSNITYSTASTSALEVIYNTNTMTIKDSTLNFVRTSNTNNNFVGLNNNAGNVNIENTDISVSISNSNYGTLYGINNNGTFTYKKGRINVGESNTNYGIYNVSTTSSLSPTSITLGAATNSYGIYNAGGTTILKKGSVLVENSNTSYGVYQNAGTVILGTYDGSGLAAADVSITDPEIRAIGTTTGIGYKKLDGTFNYYDGRIVGSTNAKPEAPSEIEPNYSVINYTENDTNYPYCILECLTPDDGSIDYDWRVNVDDTDAVYTKTITTDNLVWKDTEGNTYSEPAEGRYAEYRVSIFQKEISENFMYTVEAELSDGTPITVTQDNETGLFIISDTRYVKDVITFTSGAISDYSSINKTINLKVTSSTALVESKEYSATNKEEIFVVPKTGIYLLETWGASGDNDPAGGRGGYGGYSTGKILLTEGEKVYINVGSTGYRTTPGYNGGGEGQFSGGGATHIATKSGLLSTLEDSKDSVLIVSGGGAGNDTCDNGGDGGGFQGNASSSNTGKGGTQTAAGAGGSGAGFGQGGQNINAGGGGGGYYGGGGSTNSSDYGGGGGSGYIGNSGLFDKHMMCYNCTISNEESTLTLSNDNYSETPLADTPKKGDGYAKITFTENIESDFDYTGGPQTFVAPTSGIYNVQAWGAQGGGSLCNGNKCVDGGLGAYTSGNIFLPAGTKLYIYVGGKGADAVVRQNSLGGYNGGGRGTSDNSDDESAGAGGGATDIRLVGGTWNDNTSLASRIMVAGAGGGSAWNNVGGAGGGLIATSTYEGLHATQTSGFSFGIGRNGEGVGASDGAAGGGSGYYGGYSGTYPEISNDYGLYDYGSGGTSYISGHTGSVAIKSSSDTSPRLDSNNNICADGTVDYKCSIHYSKMKFENTVMIDGQGYNWTTEKGSYIGQTQPDETTTTGHTGNGYAKIKLIEKVNAGEFDYTGAEQTFTAPASGYYKLEAWGAQGGWNGGYGGYSSGKIFLNKGDVLYVNVGGAGQGDGTHQTVAGGYNGGGDAIADEDGNTRQGSGGGATHIAKKSGLLSQLESYKGTLSSGEDYYVSDDIIIVAGGGGGRSNNAALWSGLAGGNGGGYIGGDGESVVYYSHTFQGFGGTQTIGGVNSGDVSNYNEGSFGKGASGAVAGGGGGFFGGGNAYYSGGGGSGYIANPNLIDKHMVCYNCTTSNNVETLTLSNTDVSENPLVDNSKIGDGYAKITFISSDSHISDNLLLYYDGKNHGTSDSTWKDLSNSNNDGEIVGGATFNSESLVLDGSNDGISLDNKLKDLIKDDFTIQTTLLMAGNDSRDIIIGNYSSSNSHYATNIERGSSSSNNNKLKNRFYFNGGDNDYLTDNIFEFNKKINLAYVFEKSNKKFSVYYNGVLVGTNTYNYYTDSFDYNNVFIGRDGRTGETSLKGNIYSFSIYNKSLSSEEIQNNYDYDRIRYDY